MASRKRIVKVTQAEVEAQVVARARKVFNDNLALEKRVAQLEADLVAADKRRVMELDRARYIIIHALSTCKVPPERAKVALKMAADRWSASRKVVR